jgi:hypothetical protein
VGRDVDHVCKQMAGRGGLGAECAGEMELEGFFQWLEDDSGDK